LGSISPAAISSSRISVGDVVEGELRVTLLTGVDNAGSNFRKNDPHNATLKTALSIMPKQTPKVICKINFMAKPTRILCGVG
jgi:hypothetical protein